MYIFTEPIRKHLADFPDAQYIQAECNAVNFADQTVHCIQDTSDQGQSGLPGLMTSVEVPYDQLVVAVGAEPATFNIPGVREQCMFIKEIDDGKCGGVPE
jgi:NADH:ubiquinone reductase (non-electrogenic)